jgi:two-component system chemotaxis sensor kinase CheA
MTSPAAEDPSADIGLSAYKGLFLEEAATFLAALRQGLTGLLRNPQDHATLKEAHRAAHTLKGMASTMRYEGLVALAKRLEQPFLSQEALSREQIEGLLAGCDAFEAGLARLEAEGGVDSG